MAEDAHEDEPQIRRPLLLRRLFEVLLEADGYVPAGEALRLVEQREPFTAQESSTTSGGGTRAANYLGFASAWAKTAGWLQKTAAGWRLTALGRDTLAAVSESDNLYSILTKTYRQVYRDRQAATKDQAASAKFPLLYQALDLVEEGLWTSYSDLAALTGLANQNVGSFAAETDHPNSHRVLHADGQVSASFRWSDPDRSDDARDVLVAEGIEFDDKGRASQAQHLTSYALRDMLSELSGDEREPRAWMVRGSSVNGKDLIPTWLAKGTCSIAASQIRSIQLPVTRAEILEIVEEDYAQKSYTIRTEKIAEIDTFSNRMRVGDLVVTNSGAKLYIGMITGDAVALKSVDDRSNLRRPVEWSNPSSPTNYDALPKSASATLSSQHVVVDLTSELSALRALLVPAPTPHSTAKKLELIALSFPRVTADLADGLLVSEDWLQSCLDLLLDRHQMIFYGPPGTGKTFLARAMAKHLTVPEATKLVQFHPAYSYEDFFEGFRPVAAADGSGTVAFKLTPGPFRRLVDAARENPSTPYVLIIDEINRANLAKVFGELYFLLEYRDSAIDLLYSSGDDQGFTMPENVFIIGTMNTADRSIALVDTAMRRRFAFMALHPSSEPTMSMLTKWLTSKDLPQTAAQVMDHLNALIKDDDFKIGPSYFMRESVHRGDGMAVTWGTAILPLLEEHHYGESIDVAKRYDLARILRTIASVYSVSDDVNNNVDIVSDPEQEPDGAV